MTGTLLDAVFILLIVMLICVCARISAALVVGAILIVLDMIAKQQRKS